MQCRDCAARLQFYTSLTALVMQVHCLHCLPWGSMEMEKHHAIGDRFVNTSINLMNPTTYENSTQALPAPISFVSFTEAPIFLLTEAASV